jgi:hypothetical protein
MKSYEADRNAIQSSVCEFALCHQWRTPRNEDKLCTLLLCQLSKPVWEGNLIFLVQIVLT